MFFKLETFSISKYIKQKKYQTHSFLFEVDISVIFSEYLTEVHFK